MEKLNEVKQALKYLEIDAKAYADNFSASMIVSTKNILAIAEAFRALEQEKEAADRYAERLNTLLDDRDATLSRYEAKLAELDKQMNPDYFLNRIESSDKWGPEVELRIYESQLDASKSQDDHGGGIIELFTRPAPAADLVPEGWKLVPVEPTKQMLEASYREASVYSPTAYRAMLAAAPTPNE